jgi:hypothetical protein
MNTVPTKCTDTVSFNPVLNEKNSFQIVLSLGCHVINSSV